MGLGQDSVPWARARTASWHVVVVVSSRSSWQQLVVVGGGGGWQLAAVRGWWQQSVVVGGGWLVVGVGAGVGSLLLKSSFSACVSFLVLDFLFFLLSSGFSLFVFIGLVLQYQILYWYQLTGLPELLLLEPCVRCPEFANSCCIGVNLILAL
jgi:hypothetical protein